MDVSCNTLIYNSLSGLQKMMNVQTFMGCWPEMWEVTFVLHRNLDDCERGSPFALRRSSSYVQVIVGEIQMVSMSSRRLGTFLLCLVSLILLIDLP